MVAIVAVEVCKDLKQVAILSIFFMPGNAYEGWSPSDRTNSFLVSTGCRRDL